MNQPYLCTDMIKEILLLSTVLTIQSIGLSNKFYYFYLAGNFWKDKLRHDHLPLLDVDHHMSSWIKIYNNTYNAIDKTNKLLSINPNYLIETEIKLSIKPKIFNQILGSHIGSLKKYMNQNRHVFIYISQLSNFINVDDSRLSLKEEEFKEMLNKIYYYIPYNKIHELRTVEKLCL